MGWTSSLIYRECRRAGYSEERARQAGGSACDPRMADRRPVPATVYAPEGSILGPGRITWGPSGWRPEPPHAWSERSLRSSLEAAGYPCAVIEATLAGEDPIDPRASPGDDICTLVRGRAPVWYAESVGLGCVVVDQGALISIPAGWRPSRVAVFGPSVSDGPAPPRAVVPVQVERESILRFLRGIIEMLEAP